MLSRERGGKRHPQPRGRRRCAQSGVFILEPLQGRECQEMNLEKKGRITEHPCHTGELKRPVLKVQGLSINVCWLGAHLLILC